MWYKNLESILGLPSRCSRNQNGLEKSMEQRAQGRAVTRSSVCLTILGPRSQSRGQESHRFFFPCFWDLFRSHGWFRARSLCTKNPFKVEAQDLPTEECNSNDWIKIFACNAELARGGTGVVFSGKLKAQGLQETPCALKRILQRDFTEEMAMQLFAEFEIMKGLQHPNIAKVFWSYEVPLPAFTMELLGKTLEQSTTEQDIDNEGILVTNMPSLSISCSVVDCSKVLPSNTW